MDPQADCLNMRPLPVGNYSAAEKTDPTCDAEGQESWQVIRISVMLLYREFTATRDLTCQHSY